MGWPGPVTSRQLQAWDAWREMDLNDPGKVCSYLMGVMAEVAKTRAKDPGQVDIRNMRLKFTRPKPKVKRRLTVEEAAAEARARWAGGNRKFAARRQPEVDEAKGSVRRR